MFNMTDFFQFVHLAFFLNSNNGGACEVCPVNTFSSGTNANSCTNCPSGTNTQHLIGQTSQNACGVYFTFLIITF